MKEPYSAMLLPKVDYVMANDLTGLQAVGLSLVWV
jgi:hypothetical protein